MARPQRVPAAPEERLDLDDESAWAPYCEAIEALAVVAPRREPGARGGPLVREEAAPYSPRVRLIRGGVVIYDGPARWGV